MFFNAFRPHWMQRINNQNLHTEIEYKFAQQRPEPPLTEKRVHQTRYSIDSIVASHTMQANWGVPNNQPPCLHVLPALYRVMEDQDTALFQHLIDG